MKWCAKQGDQYVSGLTLDGAIQVQPRQLYAVKWPLREQALHFCVMTQATLVRIRPRPSPPQGGDQK